jgi:pyroglutamyl-peptidase
MQRFPAAGIALDTAILTTAYGEAERQLETLLAHDPDAVVLFGVAGRAKHIRVETVARNRASTLHPDQARFTPATRKLAERDIAERKVRGPAMRIRAAIRATGIRSELSVDAGSYLCNAVFYRALASTATRKPAPLTFFVHVPPADGRRFSLARLVRAGEAAVWAVACEAAKARTVSRRDD